MSLQPLREKHSDRYCVAQRYPRGHPAHRCAVIGELLALGYSGLDHCHGRRTELALVRSEQRPVDNA